MSLTTKGHIQISLNGSSNWVEFSPQSLRQNFESLAKDNSGRTDDGVMHIFWVRRRIRKLEITMRPLTPAEASVVLSIVQGNEYYLRYFDILENAEKTIHCYTSNSQGDCYNGILNGDGLYQGIQFNAIEL